MLETKNDINSLKYIHWFHDSIIVLLIYYYKTSFSSFFLYMEMTKAGFFFFFWPEKSRIGFHDLN